MTIMVTLATLPKPATEASTAPEPGLGLALRTLSPALRSQLDVPQGTSGASPVPADLAGLMAGDIIAGVSAVEDSAKRLARSGRLSSWVTLSCCLYSVTDVLHLLLSKLHHLTKAEASDHLT
jgi:hypothetical protein